MKSVSYMLIATCAFVVGRASSPLAAHAQQPPFAKANVKNLYRESMNPSFAPDREVLVDLVEVPPNTSLERHWHPGEEYHYYLQGEPTVSIQNGKTAKGKTGTVARIPYRAVHVLSTEKDAAKILVFRVHTAGQPMRHLADQ